MITIPREICRDFNRAGTHEWLVTNGTGSFASATITGARTRRYHGLLVAALQPPLGRTVFLAKLDEEIEVNGQTYRLGTDEYRGGVLQPSGFLYLEKTELANSIPSFSFQAGSSRLIKTVWMEHGRDTTYVRYSLDSRSSACDLTLLPFCTYRDFHEVTHGSLDWHFGVDPLPNGFRVTPKRDAPPFRVLAVPGANFTPLGLWYWHFLLRAEAERGLDHDEDLYLPGLLRARLAPGESMTIVITLEGDEELDLDVERAWRRCVARAERLQGRKTDPFIRQLYLASDQFLVSRPGATIPPVATRDRSAGRIASTVIAGYPWFGDWGRDTMISLEGLTLTTGRPDMACDILLTYSQFVSQGMLPNRFPDSGEAPEYNTVDATLWYFHAIDRYVHETNDWELVAALYPVLREIIASHVEGTRYNIRLDRADGLLYAGDDGSQLTWMDAKVGDWVVTPRIGKPVEINALWYNACRLMEAWSRELGRQNYLYERLADATASSFERFWYADGGYLFDVVDGPAGSDASLRPNQLFALGLAHSPVPLARARPALAVVTEKLLTPFGLRTLAPDHPDYRRTFTGDRRSRDGAYHNGTVWPWLLGIYIDAHRRVYPEDRQRGRFLEAFKPHLAEAGLGSISECFDGDPPHRPVGCIAQAWSVAEILRAYCSVVSENSSR